MKMTPCQPTVSPPHLRQTELTNQDVILFMVIEKLDQVKNGDEVSVLTEDINAENVDENVVNALGEGNMNARSMNQRGFNRFSILGMTARDINVIRVLFHAGIANSNGQGKAQYFVYI